MAPTRLSTLAILSALTILAGCGGGFGPAVRGSGVLKSESRDVSGFTEVALSGMGKVVIEQNGTESLTVEAEDNLLPLLESRVHNGRLTLGTKNNVNIDPTKPIRYHLTVKDLTAVDISGSGEVHATGVDTSKLTADISGSGSATLSGRADDLSLDVSGSGSYDARDLRSKTARISISGSGDAVVNATDRVTAHVSGSGSVKYLNTPTIEQHVSGSGSVAPARGT